MARAVPDRKRALFLEDDDVEWRWRAGGRGTSQCRDDRAAVQVTAQARTARCDRLRFDVMSGRGGECGDEGRHRVAGNETVADEEDADRAGGADGPGGGRTGGGA